MRMLEDAVEWMGQPTDVEVDIFDEFGISASDVGSLQSMRASGDLSRETFWRELVRRDVLSRSFDQSTETALVETEKEEAFARAQAIASTRPAAPATNGQDGPPEPGPSVN
jgi:hypothetical protein